jgi:hypothetical protein
MKRTRDKDLKWVQSKSDKFCSTNEISMTEHIKEKFNLHSSFNKTE